MCEPEPADTCAPDVSASGADSCAGLRERESQRQADATRPGPG